MAKLKRPVMLAILDGFGLGDVNDPKNAVVQANPENFQKLWNSCAHTTLRASGLDVGLPEGQMGNSEVGHLNLGAGRIVYQELTRITKDAEEGALCERPVVKDLFAQVQGKRLHLVGLLSDGGVHSHNIHLKALLKGAKAAGVQDVFVHALLDGRDVPPRSALTYIEDLEAFMKEEGVGTIATVGGRYYGMDRDKRWERVELAYQAIVDGVGPTAQSALEAVQASYEADVSDEFVIPTVIAPEGHVQEGDGLLFFNFRPDRARQFVRALIDPTFECFVRKAGCMHLHVATMTKYEDDLNAPVVYGKEVLQNTLGEVLSRGGYRQLRIAETEKYAHVTYFFNGGEENVFEGEERILIPSPKVATYDLQPEMSAKEVTDAVVKAIDSTDFDMIILNFANPDMVGHTGDFEAAKVAVKTVDTCLGRIVEAIERVNGYLLITADHGNSEMMVNHATGVAHTAHTTNLVPLVLLDPAQEGLGVTEGRLCDIAPTMLDLAGIAQPEDMTGRSVLVREA